MHTSCILTSSTKLYVLLCSDKKQINVEGIHIKDMKTESKSKNNLSPILSLPLYLYNHYKSDPICDSNLSELRQRRK